VTELSLLVSASIAPSGAERNPLNADSSSSWTTAVAEEGAVPTSTASARLVAEYLRRLECDIGVVHRHSEIAHYCVDNGFPTFEVLRTLVRFRSGDDVYSLDDVTFTVDDDAWAQLRSNNETACCPIPVWRIGARTGRQSYAQIECESLSCPQHSVPRAQALLQEARMFFPLNDVIFHAVIDDDPTILNRVRSRRRAERHPCGVLEVGTRNRQVHLFSTSDLPGSKPPFFQRLTPEEAVERLAVAASLPNMRKNHWAGEWAGRPHKRKADPGDVAVEDELMLQLPSVQRANREEALRAAREIARDRWDITPTDEAFPADVASVKEWAELLATTVEQQRAARAWLKASVA